MHLSSFNICTPCSPPRFLLLLSSFCFAGRLLPRAGGAWSRWAAQAEGEQRAGRRGGAGRGGTNIFFITGQGLHKSQHTSEMRCNYLLVDALGTTTEEKKKKSVDALGTICSKRRLSGGGRRRGELYVLAAAAAKNIIQRSYALARVA